MRIVVAALAILSLFAGLSGEATAKRSRVPARWPSSNATSDYIVRDSNQLPVGSSIWWDQMLRENRAGTCCN